MGDSLPGTGGWRTAPELYTYTHSRAHTNAPPLPSRAPPAARLCVQFGVGRSPTSPGTSAPRTRVPAGPARPTTRTQPPLAPQQRTPRGATGLARAAPPPLHLSSQCRHSWGQSRRARGGAAARSFQATCQSPPRRVGSCQEAGLKLAARVLQAVCTLGSRAAAGLGTVGCGAHVCPGSTVDPCLEPS